MAAPSDATATLFGTLAAHLRAGGERRPSQSLSRVGSFEIDRMIGQGGMSLVYAATHRYLRYGVALKLLRDDVRLPEIEERFLREARAMALLDHPNVPRVLDAGVDADVPYFAMELLYGRTVLDTVREQRRFAPRRVLDLLAEVGSVLVDQERLGVIHRDIKPGNVFERSDGTFCLFDYGVAAEAEGEQGGKPPIVGGVLPDATVTGAFVGTPRYAAPESVPAEFGGAAKADHRSDLFGLGLVAWECASGRHARKANSMFEMWQMACEPVPALSTVVESIPSWLETIVGCLTAIDPNERYPSARDLVAEVDRVRFGSAKPHGHLRGRVFVALPFARGFRRVYDRIVEVALGQRLQARRMDEQVFIDDIWGEVAREIERADVVVADFTSDRWLSPAPNPNVVTEAAHARALKRPLILLTQNPPERLPFDWRHFQVIRYRANASGLVQLGDELRVRLESLTPRSATRRHRMAARERPVPHPAPKSAVRETDSTRVAAPPFGPPPPPEVRSTGGQASRAQRPRSDATEAISIPVSAPPLQAPPPAAAAKVVSPVLPAGDDPERTILVTR